MLANMVDRGAQGRRSPLAGSRAGQEERSPLAGSRAGQRERAPLAVSSHSSTGELRQRGSGRASGRASGRQD